MGLFGKKESENQAETKPFQLEWLMKGTSHIAQLSVNREYPISSKSEDFFKANIIPGLQEIEKQGYKILSVAPIFIDPGNGEALDYVVVAQPPQVT